MVDIAQKLVTPEKNLVEKQILVSKNGQFFTDQHIQNPLNSSFGK